MGNDGERGIILVNRARRMLAEAKSIDEATGVVDIAQLARQAARKARLGLEAQNEAAEVHLRARRLRGQLIREGQRRGEIATKGRPKKSDTVSDLSELGISHKDSSRDQKILDIPDERFEQFVVDTKQEQKELTTAAALRLAGRLREPEPVETPPVPDKKFRTLVIDPPWPIKKIERDERPLQKAHLDYPTMTLEQIEDLPVGDLAFGDGCHLYLWVTQKYLPHGLRFIERWGFRYQCIMTWVKPTGITPFSWMYNTEHVIFARMGSLKLERLGIKLSFEAPVVKGSHSTKPDIFFDNVMAASPGPRLEMFARREREGFSVWGDEVSDG